MQGHGIWTPIEAWSWPSRKLFIGNGPPGAGKTALTMQLVLDALRLTPDLKACICNVEMSIDSLLDRQLARLSGIDLNTVRYRKFSKACWERIDLGLNTLRAVADRFCFVQEPFGLGQVAGATDEFEADLIVLDYIQRISPQKDEKDKRQSIDTVMKYVRKFADAGSAVIVIAAVARTKDSKGRSSYAGDGLNLASFRESSELEYGADDAFILVPDDNDEGWNHVTLKHLKSRHGEANDIVLEFDKPRQQFTPVNLKEAFSNV